jgi:hypothetical protein
MEMSKETMENKVQEWLDSRPKPKTDAYYKIWDSWGMTKEEWAVVEARRKVEAEAKGA